ncbi:hypothetical protein MNBD_GAMMA18-1006 [hydrothermal vent metagenome]|uniref:HicB protein n=1 Tax=hydrothermal vent metagenome TaxID=652676 RepID=A0A3B0ZKC0_9ZZZZ
MSKIFEYKGFQGEIEFDAHEGILFGKILFIDDLVTYEAESMPELKKEFEVTVDDYLQTCIDVGKKPEAPCKGTFNVRIGSELHRKLAVQSKRNGIKLNDFVKQAIVNELEHRSNTVDTFTHEHHVYKHDLLSVGGGDSTKWVVKSTTSH